MATLENIKIYNIKKKILENTQNNLINESKIKKKKLKQLNHITITVPTNSDGKLFGSIKYIEIINLLKKKDIDIKKNEIKTKLCKLKKIGIYNIKINLYKIQAQITLNVLSKNY